MGNFLLYGANGYTGELIARQAVGRGLQPILAGRRADAVSALASTLGLPHRVFALDDERAVDAGLADVSAVLHCAGPFSRTSKPMADACLRKRVHYLDVTGEIAVFEALAARDEEAKAAGTMLLPGIGMDVVPTDCLALYLKEQLPSATRLTLALKTLGRISHGTATTVVENLHAGSASRKDGVITPEPAGAKQRDIDFGRGPVRCVGTPWGDVSTAYYSTGIPNIDVYMAFPPMVRMGMVSSRWLGWALGSRPVQRLLQARVDAQPAGPSEAERARGSSLVWGEVVDASGQTRRARLQGPEGYTFTALTALAAMARVLRGDAPPGFQTPAKAFGASFVLEMAGVSRTDVNG